MVEDCTGEACNHSLAIESMAIIMYTTHSIDDMKDNKLTSPTVLNQRLKRRGYETRSRELMCSV